MNKTTLLFTITLSIMAVTMAANCGSNAQCSDSQTCHFTMTQNGYCCNAGEKYCGCPSTFTGHVCSDGTCYDPALFQCTSSTGSPTTWVLCNTTTSGCISQSGETACCPSGTTCDPSYSSGRLCAPATPATSSSSTTSSTAAPSTSSEAVAPVATSSNAAVAPSSTTADVATPVTSSKVASPATSSTGSPSAAASSTSAAGRVATTAATPTSKAIVTSSDEGDNGVPTVNRGQTPSSSTVVIPAIFTIVIAMIL